MSGLVIIFFEISCPMLSQDFSAVAELLVELLVKRIFHMPHVFNAPGEGDRVGFSPYDRSLESKKLAS